MVLAQHGALPPHGTAAKHFLPRHSDSVFLRSLGVGLSGLRRLFSHILGLDVDGVFSFHRDSVGRLCGSFAERSHKFRAGQ